MPFMFGFDPTFILLLPALAFAFWAQWRVQHTYSKFAEVRSSSGLTGKDVARGIMSRNGVTDVQIEKWAAC